MRLPEFQLLAFVSAAFRLVCGANANQAFGEFPGQPATSADTLKPWVSELELSDRKYPAERTACASNYHDLSTHRLRPLRSGASLSLRALVTSHIISRIHTSCSAFWNLLGLFWTFSPFYSSGDSISAFPEAPRLLLLPSPSSHTNRWGGWSPQPSSPRVLLLGSAGIEITGEEHDYMNFKRSSHAALCSLLSRWD
ncbi:hypothetical protein CfE428DRAFT_4651 [Chthoniobacter flavus Ellin428]|uniref:Uncharacterized protein n=1 Tax=Chthoniobacter flavus Ellin428 TaxID=497964 RepID=B4D6W1_9BACT|nr:hypothetical protein CfE428DRAFT_4651 [Chthoniobacter flavus Ellin428]TCO88519.1 hypothetical protein EV701_117121 [Chthoniobacter flavus]